MTAFIVARAGGIAPSITSPSTLPSGTQNVTYNYTMTAFGGTPPYTWLLISQTGTNSFTVSSGGLVESAAPNVQTDSLTIQVMDSVGATNTGVFSVSIASAGSYQLAAGHWVPAKMALTASRVVIPRPDSETSSSEYTRNAHPNIQYQCPVRVQGGAWPHWFELITAPAGATIGQGWTAADYGIVKWTPTSGTQTFTVRVHDQDGATVDVTWTVTVGTSWVVFVDSVNGNDITGSGTFAAPWQTYSKAITACTTGQYVCMRAGSYTVPVSGSGIVLSATKHRGVFAYPGERVAIDYSNSTSDGVWSAQVSGFFFSGIDWTCPTAAAQAESSVIRPFPNFNRYYLWNCTATGNPQITAGTNNDGWLSLSSTGVATSQQYVMMLGCTGSGFTGSSGAGNNAYFDLETYSAQYVLVEDHTFGQTAQAIGTGNRGRARIFIKGGGNHDWSIRRCKTNGAVSNNIIDFYCGADGFNTPSGNIEACYNTFANTETSKWSATVTSLYTGSVNGNLGGIPYWSYRNTYVGVLNAAQQTSNTAVRLVSTENDVSINDVVSLTTDTYNASTALTQYRMFANTAAGGTDLWHKLGGSSSGASDNTWTQVTLTYSGLECHQNSAAGVLDGSYKLTGIYRTNYLGTRGAEIA